MNIIVDTSIVLAVALEEPEKTAIVEHTSGADISAPEVLTFEIGNALSAMCRRRQLSPEQVLAVHTVTQQIPIRLLSIDITGALNIALKFNIYAYDAYFLECAHTHGHPLMTLDRRIREVAAEMGIEVLE